MSSFPGIEKKQCFAFKAACLLLSGITILALTGSSEAADKNVINLSPALKIREVVVSGSDTSQWPRGNWYPVPLKKYDLLKKTALLKKNTPPNSWIQEATYEATLEGDQLTHGRLNYLLHCSRNEPGFINLSKLNLAIHELKWGNQDAVWGLAPDQKTLLLIDHFNEPLSGAWSLKGRELPHRMEFSFQLPETVVSRVHLKIPQGMVLTTSVGYVSGPVKSDVQKYDLWQIELGGQSQFQAVIHQNQKRKKSPTQILYHQFAQVGIREDGLRLREDFQIEVLNQPVRKLEFEASTEYEIYSVTLGNDLSLPFEIKKQKDRNLISVDLIDPLIGISRPLSVRALASPSLDREISIPRLKLKQAHFLGGTVHLDISAPLETHEIQLTDLRQTGVLIQDEQGEAYDFKQYSPDARLVYRLALPDLNLSARVQSLIRMEDKVWKMKSQIHWASAAGSTYRLESMIPAGWEITQVNSLAEKSSGDLVWDVERSAKQQKLSVRLPSAVSPEAPYSLEIQARRLIPVANRAIDLYGVNPLGCDNVDQILELDASSEMVKLFDPGKEVEELVASDLPKKWNLSSSKTGTSRYFHLAPYSGFRWGALNLAKIDQTLQVIASSYIALNDDVVQENFILNCVPVSRGIKRVLVYLSEPGESVEWSMNTGSGLQLSLTSQKLPVSRHQKWQLPQTGELWELKLSAPVFKELELRGERRRPFLESVKAALIYVPQANPFRGVVRVLNSNELNLRMKTEGLFTAPGTENKPAVQRTQRNYEWEYEWPLGALTITRSSEISEGSLDQGTATVVVDTKFGHGTGEPDVHLAKVSLDLSSTFDDKFIFRFPSDVKLISTTVDERRITPIEAEGQYLVPLFDQLDSYQITIQYQTPSVPAQLKAMRKIPFPQISQRVLETDWNFTLPEGTRLIRGPVGMVLQESLPEESMARRFFGILGKKQSVNPHAETNWSAVNLFPVRFGTLETSNSDQANIISWIVFLLTMITGLLLRMLRFGIRNKLCVMVALVSLVFSWIFPFALAQIAGSCFTGILIVMLIPRRFLWQETKILTEDQSTKAYQKPVSSTYSATQYLIITMLGISASGYAQDLPKKVISPSEEQSRETRTELVLLPESSAARTESIAYLTPELLQELESIVKENEQPEYLLSSAFYEGDMRDSQLLTVKAVFQVKIPLANPSALIHLPINGGNLSGPDSCKVDGNVVPVLLGADKQSILVNVNNVKPPISKRDSRKTEPVEAQKPISPFAFQDHKIELVLHPAVKFSATSGQFEIGIPRISKSHISLQFKDAAYLVEINETAGVSKYQLAEKKQFSTFLKENSILKVKWQTSQDSEESPLQLEAAILTNVEVSPSLIHLDVQASYKVREGKVDYLLWKIPPGTILRSVKSPGMTVIPALSPAVSNNYRELLLELPEPKTGEFVINATFDLPANVPSMSARIPPLDFSSGKANSKNSEMKVNSHIVGVRTGPEFELEMVKTLPEGVLSVSSKTPSKQIEESILKSSELLFQVNKPAPIFMELESKNPERTARINQTAIVNQKNIDWTFSAEIRISQAPAFRHTLIVPKELNIESLSVKEEDVDRLAHWHRVGNKITLFLKNKTSGLQDLTLKGWLPVRKYGAIVIPSIQIEESEIEDSLLTIYKKPQIDVQMTSSHYRRIDEDAAQTAPATDSISFVGRFQETDSISQPITLFVKLQDLLIAADSLTIVDALEDQKIEVTQTLHFLLPASDMKKLILLIPAEYAGNYMIDGMPYEVQEKSPDGQQRVVLLPKTSETNEKTVIVRVTLPKPVNELIVTPVTLENSKLQNNYLLLSSKPEFVLNDKKNKQTVPPKKIPTWIQARCDASPDLDCGRIFTSTQLPWKLISASHNKGKSIDDLIPFLETQIILGEQGAVNGMTHIKLFNQSRHELKLEWPEKTKLIAILINGESDATLKQEMGELAIPLNGGPRLMNLTVFWESYQIDHEYFVEKIRLQMPRPANYEFDNHLVKIISSERNQTFLSSDVTPFQYLADKLSAQLKIAEIELELGVKINVSQSSWGEIEDEYNQLELILADSGNDGQGTSEKLNRMSSLKQRVSKLKQFVATDAELAEREQPFVNHFQQKLGPDTVQKVRYYSSAENSNSEQSVLTAWVIPKHYLDIAVACLSLLILLPVLSRCIQPRSADWLNAHPMIGLLVLGLIWMLFLSPQYIGVGIIAMAVFMAFKTNQTITLSTTQAAASSPGTQNIKE
ncbi:MAG: hypothetical protein K0U86_05400 [Planctomycetes bacterium]|nr:hypothetical protein [Planctomycetota bacterium]MCH9724324.1 hypothetical protein [Planctomycetota bacterium]MCH9777343.1 hypothetical protein [Planctomycetota bacterium]